MAGLPWLCAEQQQQEVALGRAAQTVHLVALSSSAKLVPGQGPLIQHLPAGVN